MAITFPITGVKSTYTNSQSPTFTLGTAPAENDILVAYCSTTTDPQGVTDPSGWTNVLGSNTNEIPADLSNSGVMLYHRVTSAEAGSSTVTWTLTNIWGVAKRGATTVAVLRGVATTGELVGASSGSDAAAADPWVIPSVTPGGDNCQIMAGVSGDDVQTQTTPGTHTLVIGDGTIQSNYLYSDDTLGSNGVSTGTTNVTPSAADEYVSIVACFAPVPAGTTTGTASGTISVNGSAQGSIATKLFVGTDAVDAVYVGTDLVDRVYYGTTRVF